LGCYINHLKIFVTTTSSYTYKNFICSVVFFEKIKTSSKYNIIYIQILFLYIYIYYVFMNNKV